MMRKILTENILFDQDSISNRIKYISEKEFNVCLKNREHGLLTIGINWLGEMGLEKSWQKLGKGWGVSANVDINTKTLKNKLKTNKINLITDNTNLSTIFYNFLPVILSPLLSTSLKKLSSNINFILPIKTNQMIYFSVVILVSFLCSLNFIYFIFLFFFYFKKLMRTREGAYGKWINNNMASKGGSQFAKKLVDINWDWSQIRSQTIFSVHF